MKSVLTGLSLIFALCVLHAEDSPIKLTADSVLVFDADTGRVILKKNENLERPVASTQKLLTALIIAETGNLDRMVTITPDDTHAEPTKLNLKPGDSYSRRDLLTALLVHSPNDAARALARDNAGSIEAFAEKMNQRMVALGGTSSHFINPNGLPVEGQEQHSTARDMARVARMDYANPLLRQIMNTRYLTFEYANGKHVVFKNTNHVLRTFSFCNGMKTGYTDQAKHCLISSGSWRGRDVIAIVYGDNKSRIWNESANLLAYALGMSRSDIDSCRLPPNKQEDE